MKSSDQSYKNWQAEFNKFEDDYDNFRDYFEKNKKCNCHMYECKHFDKATVKVLGERIDKIFQARLNMGFKTYLDAIRKD